MLYWLDMSAERQSSLDQARPKLTEAVQKDYPTASEVLVSFPEEWELVELIKKEGIPLYIAAFPPEKEKPRCDQFPGLSLAVNLSLTSYQLYRFFRPWPMPTVIVDWNATAGQGRVVGIADLKVQLRDIGQAQAWYGRDFAVLWESYLYEAARRDQWQELLAEIWRTVETSIGSRKIYTTSHEPTFEEGYTDFLSGLGYAPDAENPRWWSKEVAHKRGK